MHLTDAHAFGDLALTQARVEAKLDDRALPLGERVKQLANQHAVVRSGQILVIGLEGRRLTPTVVLVVRTDER